MYIVIVLNTLRLHSVSYRMLQLDQRGSDFTLSFLYCTPENTKAITYFAFTYPFSYTDLQNYLKKIDAKMGKCNVTCTDDIYYHRECAIKSLEGRRLDVLTISSYRNISMEREDRLSDMFPEKSEERPYKFWDKKVCCRVALMVLFYTEINFHV